MEKHALSVVDDGLIDLGSLLESLTTEEQPKHDTLELP